MKHALPVIHSIIPAAGVGQRFGAKLPKQYLEFINSSVIEASIKPLLQYSVSVTVAISEQDQHWQRLPMANNSKVSSVVGGDTRAQSVTNALNSIKPLGSEDWVMVHDSVRPLVSKKDIEKLIETAVLSQKGAILATPLNETIKKQSANHTEAEIATTVDRSGLWAAQTPQMFPLQQLKLAANADNGAVCTDEASMVEAAGHRVLLVACDRFNIKITQPQDISLTRLLARLVDT